MTSPLQVVLSQIEAGTPTVAEIARRTDLPDEMVRAAIDHLVRSGRLTSSELSVGCPTGGCGTCPSSGGCALPANVSRRPGLVSLTLTRRAS